MLRHILANPTNPTICPAIALVVFVFSPTYLTRNCLFLDIKQERRFEKHIPYLFTKLSKAAKLVIVTLVPSLKTPGIRKGTTTSFFLMVDGPNTLHMNLRVAWNNPDVLRLYVTVSEGGGDQQMERILSALPSNDL